MRNWVNQNDKIDSQQAQQNTNLVNNKTANLVNINQQIRYLNQQLRDQLTKSLVLKSQNKSSENTRHRIRDIKQQIRHAARSFNSEISDPVRNMQAKLNENQTAINATSEQEANGEIRPKTAN